jgi:hypothetical protein
MLAPAEPLRKVRRNGWGFGEKASAALILAARRRPQLEVSGQARSFKADVARTVAPGGLAAPSLRDGAVAMRRGAGLAAFAYWRSHALRSTAWFAGVCRAGHTFRINGS